MSSLLTSSKHHLTMSSKFLHDILSTFIHQLHGYIYIYSYLFWGGGDQARAPRALWALVGVLGPLWARPLWAPLGRLWARPLWASLRLHGPGPCGRPWALVGRAFAGRIVGRAIMGPPGRPGPNGPPWALMGQAQSRPPETQHK